MQCSQDYDMLQNIAGWMRAKVELHKMRSDSVLFCCEASNDASGKMSILWTITL